LPPYIFILRCETWDYASCSSRPCSFILSKDVLMNGHQKGEYRQTASTLTMQTISSIGNSQNPFKDLIVYNGTYKSVESRSIISLIVALSR
jgi:hypothetical protein